MKNKFVKVLLVILLFLSLSFLSLNQIDNIKADSGWDSSYDSGSSWDSGSDWDSSSSWDDDYDYDSDSSSSSSSCTTEECKRTTLIFTTLILLFSLGFPIIFFIIISKNSKKRVEQFQKQFYDSLKNIKDITPEEIYNIIPNFNIEEFNSKAYQTFYDVQMAWMNFDYDKLKELLTDELYNSYVMQLDALKVKNQRNTMKDFELINCHISDLKEENGMYIVRVYLNVKFYDYVEDINTGKVLRGTSNRKLDNTYSLSFIKTKEESNNINICPQCGAPVEGNVTGICEYCKAKLINETHDWIMSKKEIIRQK